MTDEPGITRDRIYGQAEWRGRELEIVDTGGIVPRDKEAQLLLDGGQSDPVDPLFRPG